MITFLLGVLVISGDLQAISYSAAPVRVEIHLTMDLQSFEKVTVNQTRLEPGVYSVTVERTTTGVTDAHYTKNKHLVLQIGKHPSITANFDHTLLSSDVLIEPWPKTETALAIRLSIYRSAVYWLADKT